MYNKKVQERGRKMDENKDGKIIDRDIEQEMKTAYIDYAMSVIVARALPDVRDGLKPVHRRILYTMYQDGLTSDKPYRKSAKTVSAIQPCLFHGRLCQELQPILWYFLFYP